MLEQKVEAHLLARCREMGFLCMKFTSPGRAGVPDRVIITPTGTMFVETKRPGGNLRRLQQEVIEKMRRAGAEVHVVDAVAGIDELVESLATRMPSAVSSRVYSTTVADANDDHSQAVFPTEPYASRMDAIRRRERFEYDRAHGLTDARPPTSPRPRGDLRAMIRLVDAEAWASAVRTSRAGGAGWGLNGPERAG